MRINYQLGKFLRLVLIIISIDLISCFKSNPNYRNNLGMTKLTDCSAKFDDGSILDLSSLDNTAQPLSTSDSVFTYYFNPCTPISCLPNQKTSALCKKDKEDGTPIDNLGDQSSSIFNFDKISLNIVYSSSTKTSNIQCLCTEEDTSSFEFVRCPDTCYFKLTSKCCCPNGCKSKKPTSNGLSFGSILLIIFFSILAVYFVGGIIFLKYIKNFHGANIIPNHEFWLSIPGNVKGGFNLIISKARGRNYQNF